MKNKQNSGFTLLEVMITVAVLAVLIGIATPSLQNFLQNSRLDDAAQGVYSMINITRQTAISSGQQGFVCRSNQDPVTPDNPRCRNGLSSEWDTPLLSYKTFPGFIFDVGPTGGFANRRLNSGTFNRGIDATLDGDTRVEIRSRLIERSLPFKENGVEYRSNSTDVVIVFNSDGTLANTAPFRIAVCDVRGEAEGKYVEINAVGRIFLRNIEGSGLSCDNPG